MDEIVSRVNQAFLVTGYDAYAFAADMVEGHLLIVGRAQLAATKSITKIPGFSIVGSTPEGICVKIDRSTV